MVTMAKTRGNGARFLATQERIVKLYGREAINEASERLCEHCKRFCNGVGLPLTTKGEECPYYALKEG
jgi:hypothetical protein